MRTALTVLLLALTAGAAVIACTNEMEEDCLSGPCGDVQPPPTSSSSGGTCEGDEFGGAGDLPCDVWQVMHDRCHCCHQEPQQNGAPFPLLTYEDTRAEYFMGKLRWERMAEVTADDGLPHMPLATAAQLSTAQLKVLQDWFAACAPPAAEYKGGVPGCDEKEPPPAECDPP